MVKGINDANVTRWLLDTIDGLKAPFTFDLITGGRSNLTYRVTDVEGRRVVLRRPPTSHVLKSAHDMAREHRIISALAQTGVPVAPALGFCDDPAVNDQPFYVMDFVEGHILRMAEEVEHTLDEPARRAAGRDLVDVLVALHAVDVDAVGLGDLARRDGYIERQLKRWHGQFLQSQEQAKEGGFYRPADVVSDVHRRLAERVPDQVGVSIAHGDYRLDNTMIGEDGRVRAVLDWELCTLGDPLADVGTLLVYWTDPDEVDDSGLRPATAAAGMPARDEVAKMYADATGRDVSALSYYVAFAHWRLACIIEGVYARYAAGAMGEQESVGDLYAAATIQRAEQALQVLDAGRLVRPEEETMRDAVICEPLRTPVGAFGGALRDVPAHEMASTVIRALLDRTGISPDSVDDVVLGNCYPTMEAPAIGRMAALDAGLPVTVTGMQVDRRCGSGLQAVLYAAMQVQNGVSDVVLAGGAESMSNAPFYSVDMRWGIKGVPGVVLHDGLTRGRITAGGKNHPVPGGMIETAENLRREYRIPREEQDEYSVRSHQRAAAAQSAGTFAEEIVPVTVKGRKGDTVVDTDEHIRPDSTVEKLSGLRPIMGRQDPDATVTAGNASGQNDGAAICIVTHPDRAAELGLRPLVRLVSWGLGGVPPATMGIGPVPAVAKALDAADLQLADMDLIELNEAFAAQVLAVTREWKLADADFDRLNVNGSGISLGHPVGATGGRILATLAREMDRRGVRYGLETMCIGGGQGLAAVFERVA